MQSDKDRVSRGSLFSPHCRRHRNTEGLGIRKCHHLKPQGRSDQYEMSRLGYTTVLDGDNTHIGTETHRATSRGSSRSSNIRLGHVAEREAESDTEIRSSTLLTPVNQSSEEFSFDFIQLINRCGRDLVDVIVRVLLQNLQPGSVDVIQLPSNLLVN
jgi:hypothetical protein